MLQFVIITFCLGGPDQKLQKGVAISYEGSEHGLNSEQRHHLFVGGEGEFQDMIESHSASKELKPLSVPLSFCVGVVLDSRRVVVFVCLLFFNW